MKNRGPSVICCYWHL